MENVKLPDLGFDWNDVLDMVQSTGVEFGINLVTAIVIFYFGRTVVGLMMRGLNKVMQAQDVDKTLQTFVSNFARMVLLTFVTIAAISAVGIQTTSFIAILGAAGLAIGWRCKDPWRISHPAC